MKKIILLFIFISCITTFSGIAKQTAEPDHIFAGTIWYNWVDEQVNHNSFICFDKQAAVCTIGFVGGDAGSEIHDFIYNVNEDIEIILCRPEKPMQPVVILTILEDNTFDFNFVDLPVGNKYKKIQYTADSIK